MTTLGIGHARIEMENDRQAKELYERIFSQIFSGDINITGVPWGAALSIRDVSL